MCKLQILKERRDSDPSLATTLKSIAGRATKTQQLRLFMAENFDVLTYIEHLLHR
jgi:hypothetical protein